MLSVLAAMPPTSTLAPRANSTPLGLTRKICPLAVRRPKISEGLLPSTRLSATLDAPGCRKRTHSDEPMEKLVQLRMAFCDAWSICSVCALGWETVAEPAATWPPVGSANTVCDEASSNAASPTTVGASARRTSRAAERSRCMPAVSGRRDAARRRCRVSPESASSTRWRSSSTFGFWLAYWFMRSPRYRRAIMARRLDIKIVCLDAAWSAAKLATA